MSTTVIKKDADVVSMSKKLLKLWDKEYLLAIIATPFTFVFVNWLFRQDEQSYNALKFFAIIVAIVSYGSVLKHIGVGVIEGHYKKESLILVNEDNDRADKDRIRLDELENHRFEQETKRVEKHFQMEQLTNTAAVTLEVTEGIYEELHNYFETMDISDHQLVRTILNMGKTARISLHKLSRSSELKWKDYINEYYNIEESGSISTMPSPVDVVEESTVGKHEFKVDGVDLNLNVEEVNQDSKDIHTSYEQ